MDGSITSPENNIFQNFNESRENFVQQFRDLIEIIGNNVFHGNINLNAPNLMEEINRQQNLKVPEKNVLKHLYFYVNNLINSRFLLGVFGRFKSGKSTILNALAGEDISPMDTRISTGVLNFTYYNEKEECLVVYDNGKEISIPPQDKVLYVDFRHNPDNEQGIYSVRHGSPNLNLEKEIVFVDTPGLEAVNRIHEQITLDFVGQCHAAIVVSTFPPFGTTELQFYEKIKDVIPNIFLVQNLPADKLEDWIKLETQTLFNLHKMGFFELDTNTYDKDRLRDILNKIADNDNAEELEKFKKIHNVHLYSINAKIAYEAIVNESGQTEISLEKSYFPKFKQELYQFLADHKGLSLIADYFSKGKMVLNELNKMIKLRQELLQKSLEEIEQQIKEHEYAKEKVSNIVEMIVDRTTLKLMKIYKTLKDKIINEDLTEALEDLNKTYGDLNIFRLRKLQVKEIKTKIGEFNRLFSQRLQEYFREVYGTIAEAQEKIGQTIENHGIFGKLEINTNFSQVSVGEISGAGYIEYGFEWAFRGGMAYFVGSIAGGGGIALLGGGLLPLLIGGAIGLGLSYPLAKRCAPALEYAKNLFGKIANRPTHGIFQNFRNNVREKLDEIEKVVSDEVISDFKHEVTKNTNDYFKFFSQRLYELKNKKAHGMTQEECDLECKKLQAIIDKLQSIEQQLGQTKEKPDVGEKIQGLFRGIKGYLKKKK